MIRRLLNWILQATGEAHCTHMDNPWGYLED